ncbi:class I SAM-dependent methyltransferase [Streptomyces sp. NPDC057521]|uniref:class I SAM-dependent methyltransferase n=1 Tax=Streptomyces sp. NPDC057521 TaxID=3346156 RepID=UPI00368E937D
MTEYVKQDYWDEVARHLPAREIGGDLVAGDDTPFYRIKRAAFLEKLLAPALADATTILEVGSGPGGNVGWLTGKGKKVTGADISPEMLAQARMNVEAEFVQTDGSTLPFDDRSFDAVFAATVLQHNRPADAEALLREMARVADSSVHLFEDTSVLPVQDRPSHWLRRPSWYAQVLEANGFVLTKRERLRQTAQEAMAVLVRTASPRTRHEGARTTERHRKIEAALLPVTRAIDAVVPPAVGLTRMSFSRRI